MNEKEMFERKVWLEVFLKAMEIEKSRSHKECSDRADCAVQAYRRMFPNNDSDTRD